MMWTPAAFRRARETGAQKWLRDPASLNASVDKCSPGGDLFQGRRDGGAIARRSDRRGGADVHEIDHGD